MGSDIYTFTGAMPCHELPEGSSDKLEAIVAIGDNIPVEVGLMNR